MGATELGERERVRRNGGEVGSQTLLRLLVYQCGKGAVEIDRKGRWPVGWALSALLAAAQAFRFLFRLISKVRQSLEQPHEQTARASLGSPSPCLGSIPLSSLVPSIPQPHLILVPHFAVSWAGGAAGITNDVFRPCGPPHFLEGREWRIVM